jgi:hypothetical protein
MGRSDPRYPQTDVRNGLSQWQWLCIANKTERDYTMVAFSQPTPNVPNIALEAMAVELLQHYQQWLNTHNREIVDVAAACMAEHIDRLPGAQYLCFLVAPWTVVWTIDQRCYRMQIRTSEDGTKGEIVVEIRLDRPTCFVVWGLLEM